MKRLCFDFGVLKTLSLPLRECGLKHHGDKGFRIPVKVTPLAGVWIETQRTPEERENELVTPLAGVWIETIGRLFPFFLVNVTPLAGVWIETTIISSYSAEPLSHSPCGSVD